MNEKVVSIYLCTVLVFPLFFGGVVGSSVVAAGNDQTAGNDALAAAGNQDWAEFHGSPDNTGSNQDGNGPVDNVREKWRFEIGDGFGFTSSPVVGNGTVFVGSDDHKIYAVNLSDGDEQWSYRTDEDIMNSPVYRNGRVFVVSEDIYAFDADTGEVLWRYEKPDYASDVHPTVANGTLYANYETRVVALDTKTGKVDWNIELGDRARMELWSGIGYSNGSVFLGTDDGIVYSLNGSTGSIEWEFDASEVLDSQIGIRTAPAIHGGKVYVGTSGYNDGDGVLFALDVDSGSEVWRYTTTKNAILSSPAVYNDTVYFGSHEDVLRAVNATTGESRWTVKSDFGPSSPVVVDGVVYVGGKLLEEGWRTGGNVFAVNATNGSVLWSKSAHEYVASSPAVVNGMVVVGREDAENEPGTLYAFDEGEPPVADFAVQSDSPIEDSGTVFDGSLSSSSDERIVEYQWDFDGDGTYETSGQRVSHVYTDPGTYTVTLEVTTRKGAVDTVRKSVRVYNKEPLSRIEYRPDRPVTNETIVLNASSSNDTDGTVTTYEWDVDGDGQFERTGVTTNVSFDEAGDYDVSLRTTGSDGTTNTTTESLTVFSRAPEGSFHYSPTSPIVGEEIELDATESVDLDGSIVSYEWDLDGDGVYETDGYVRLTHNFTDAGQKTVSVRLTDNEGKTTTVSRTIRVFERSKVAGRFAWSQFGFSSDGTAHAPNSTGPIEAIQRQWQFQTNATIAASPIVSNETVYIGTRNHSGGVLHAINTNTGNETWHFETDGAIRASVAVSRGIVVLGVEGPNPAIYGLNATNGEIVWNHSLPGSEGVEGSPAVSKSIVYVPAGDVIRAINVETGEVVWSHQLESRVRAKGGVTVADGGVFVGDRRGFVYRLDASTGAVSWRYDTSQTLQELLLDGGDGHIRTAPAVHNGTVFVGGSGYRQGSGVMYALNATTGAEVWRFQTSSTAILSSPAVADGTVVFGTHEEKLRALNASTGAIEWSVQTRNLFHSSPSITEDVVYVGTGSLEGSGSHGNVLAVDLHTGAEVWREPTAGYVISSPAIADETLYIGSSGERDSGGIVYSFTEPETTEITVKKRSANNASADVQNVKSNSSVTVPLPPSLVGTETNTQINQIGIKIDNDTSSINMSVNRSKTALTGIPELTTNISYLNVTHPWSVDEKNITEATIHFKIKRQELSKRGLSPEEVTLYRFTNAEWTQLSTTVVTSTSEYYYYRASTPGFSTFGISTSKNPEPHNKEPTIAVSLSATNVSAGDEVTLDATRSSDSDGSIARYQWDLNGDGSYDLSGAKVSHTFSEPGNYTIILRVKDDDGATNVTSQSIEVSDTTPPEIVVERSDEGLDTGETATFDAAGSSDNVGIAEIKWAFGDGTSTVGENATHAYDSPGTYTVTVTVKDRAGNVNRSRFEVDVQSETEQSAPSQPSQPSSPSSPTDPPSRSEEQDDRSSDQSNTTDSSTSLTASLSAPDSVTPGEPITLDATASSGQGLQYKWDIDGDGTYERASSKPTTVVTYSETGTKTATVEISDGTNTTDTATVTIRVESNETQTTTASDGSDPDTETETGTPDTQSTRTPQETPTPTETASAANSETATAKTTSTDRVTVTETDDEDRSPTATRAGEQTTGTPQPTATTETTSSNIPGFDWATGTVALLSVVLIAIRRR
jgi:PGF-pre-PGF domain-containing protein